MPRFDGTGPDGRGPITGRGLGYCNTTYETGNATVVYGGRNNFRRNNFGRGCRVGGFGRRNGFCRRSYFNGYSDSYEKDSLEREKEMLQSRLANINESLGKMDS
ncbi:DUF5320 domain-containing protein [Haloimpatiens sp. FM7330]|uniref:DUF5320 domain-containing protein n=1 Tax=Haloimpatiens sp. FM7330 TaxID=3298610 RepID=UPI0036417453